MWWLVAAAWGVEVQGFRRLWVDPATLDLRPAVAAPAEVSGYLLVPATGSPPLAEIAAALRTEPGITDVHPSEDGTALVIAGPGAADATWDGRPAAELGAWTPLPVLRPRMPGAPPTLAVQNPYLRRADVYVEGTLVGQLAPRAEGAITGVPAGSWTVEYRMPDGDGTTVQIVVPR